MDYKEAGRGEVDLKEAGGRKDLWVGVRSRANT